MKKVKIYSLSNPLKPKLLQTISTTGEVKDLEIVSNKLYIYEETTSWLKTRGYTTVYNITEINKPVKETSFEKRCNDAEMESSEGTVYLGCKNGQFKVTVNGFKGVSGEKNYVREGYVYKTRLYQVFSGRLHISEWSN